MSRKGGFGSWYKTPKMQAASSTRSRSKSISTTTNSSSPTTATPSPSRTLRALPSTTQPRRRRTGRTWRPRGSTGLASWSPMSSARPSGSSANWKPILRRSHKRRLMSKWNRARAKSRSRVELIWMWSSNREWRIRRVGNRNWKCKRLNRRS